MRSALLRFARRALRSPLGLFAWFAFAGASLHAQSVHWDPASGALPVGQSTALRLVFENCLPVDENVTPPKVDGLVLQLYGSRSNELTLNGVRTLSRTYTFAAQLTRNQPVEIPGFTVETDKGVMRVAPARYQPTAATVGRSGTPVSEAATARLTVSPPTVWAGQVFDLEATISASRSYYPQFTRGFDWTSDPLIIESWSEPQQVDLTVGVDQHAGVIYHARALARHPGRFNLNAATHLVNLSVGVTGFGFFQQRQYDQYSITSNTPTLEVRALPPGPAEFSGAVGQFKLVSKVVPEKASIGEPVTWTVELSGTGNWPDIAGLPAREVSNNFQVVQPKAKRTPVEGKMFDVTLTEDIVLVPTKPGTYPLGPLQFVYFDPKAGTYETLTAPRTTVTIETPTHSPLTLNLGGKTPSARPPDNATPEPARTRPLATPAPPAGIPRDPLPGDDAASAPLRTRSMVLGLVAQVVALFGFWFWLALREAQRTDPLRPHREAHARLAQTLIKLRHPAETEQSALLLAWQRDAATLWQLTHAAPPPSAIIDPEWSKLWQEADRTLYGSRAPLPSDWLARAEAALAAKRVPSFRPLRLFLPRNLFPFAALLMVALAIAASLRAAEDPHAAYRSGNFAEAEKAWREAIAHAPTNWIARHNLSLALAQQDRASEAAGHATAAFVQNPSDPAVRWHFAHSVEKAGSASQALAAFVRPGPLQTLARTTSAPQWQRLVLAAAILIAAAIGWMLFNTYGRKSVRHYMLAGVILFAGITLAATASAGILAYGIAAKENAVIVARPTILRSIPTEADTTQKTTVLAAGSIALVEKTFLSDRWLRLAFENGQTGWVRKEEIVLLWR